MTASLPHLEVTVVSSQDITPRLDGVSGNSCPRVSAMRADEAAVPGELDGTDCLVVDTVTIDAWRSVVADVTDTRPTLPVVVLVADEYETTVPKALEDGATDHFPRHVCRKQPSLFARQLASTVQQTTDPEFEQMYQELFENVSDGLVIHEPESGEIIDCNDQFCEMTGYGHDELVGETIELITAPDEAYSYERAKDHIREAQTDGPQLFEWHNQRRNGETFYSEIHLDVMRLYGEEYVLASARDITARKRREREFEQIFNGVNDMIAVHHPETGELLAVNDTLSEVTGYDRETLLEMGAEGLTVDTETFGPDRVQSLIERVMDGADIEPYEQAIETAGGDIRWLDVNPTRAVIDGEPRFLAIARDVTERRQRQKRLEIERDRRSALFEDNPDPVLRLEYVGQKPVIREVNPAFEEVFGLRSERVVGSTVGDALVPDDQREQYEQFRKRVANGETIEGEAERQTGSGRREFVFKVIQLDIASETATDAYVWYTDVTERRRRERAIQTLQDATTRMQRASTASEVARIASESAETALGLSETVCWLHDAATDQLEPVATTTPGRHPGQLPTLTPDHDEYDVFESGSIGPYTPTAADSAVPMDRALLIPLGSHGLLAASRTSEPRDDDVHLEVARTLADQTATALARVERGREVRQTKRRLQAIVDRIDEAIFFAPLSELTDSHPAPDFVSSGYEEIWGQPLETVHERYEEGFFGTVHPDDIDSYRAFLDEIVDAVHHDGGEERYTTEYRIERPSGEVRWVESDFYPTTWDDDTPRIVVVSRDITAQKARQRTLESFHDATAELTTADSVRAASEVAVDAAADVLDIPATAIYHYDADTAALVPTATGPAMPDPGDLTQLSADHAVAWETFVDEQLHRVNVDTAPYLAAGPGTDVLLVPLGGNGILGVWEAEAQLSTDDASILAATVEAALNRLRGERQLESRREELQTQTQRAQRLDAIAELSHRVDAAITTSSSRTGIQEAVCSELTDVEPFTAAFIAAAEVGTDRLTPRTVAGIDRDHVDQQLQGSQSPDPHPASAAWQTGDARVVNDLVGSGYRSEWRQILLKNGAGSVCAVPLTYNGVTHGVLTVVADDPGGFGDRERDVLSQLGKSIGYAITAVERQRALESDDTIELEFQG